MKPWWKLVRPKQDIIDGESVDLGVYAIHLDQIASNDPNAPKIYREPTLFFKNTVFTNGMMTVIRHVHNRLSGNMDSGSVINLNTAFGGGKTHTLVLLYHLFGNGEKARKWLPKESLEKIAYQIQDAEIPKARIITWVGQNYSYNNPDKNGMRTPWGQIFGQMGPEALKRIRPYDEDKTRPDTDTIRKLLGDGEPTLLLLDEVLNAMEAMRGVEVGETTLNHQFRHFYQNLTSVVASMPHISIVNSFSKSIGNVTDKDQEDLELLQNVSGRVDESIETTTGNEISLIIRRRLFEDVEDKADKKEIEKTIKSWVQWTIKNKDHLVLDLQIGELEEVFNASYPFHPRVFQVFEKKWQGLHSFGRTRGVLRMLSLWLKCNYMEATKENLKNSLITVGNAPMGDSYFANIVYGQMGNMDLAIPINSDLVGANGWATVLDQESSPAIKNLCLHKQVGTAVFFESTGGQKQEFASTGEVRWALCGPDAAEFTDIDTCLKNLENKGHYFRSRNKLHRISTKANLNKLKNTERSSIDDKDLDTIIEKTVSDEIGDGKEVDVVMFPRYFEDVPDTPTFKLCILPPDVLPGDAENQVFTVAKGIIDKSKRTYKRHVAFLTTVSGRAKMTTIARDHLTYDAILRHIANYQLEDADRDELPIRSKQTEEELRDEVWSSYRKLYLVNTDGSLEEKDILGLLNRSMSQHGLAAVVEDRLKQYDIISTRISHRVTENWPPIFSDKPWPLQSLRDNVFQSEKAAKVRLINSDGLKKSIMEWIKGKHVILVSLNEKGDYKGVVADDKTSELELASVITIDNNTGIILPHQLPKPQQPQEVDQEHPVKPEIPQPPLPPKVEPDKLEPCAIMFSIPVKKLTSVAMAISMNFEETRITVIMKGKPKKGTTDALESLKNTIKQNGGAIDEGE